jgi:hypothetical protein
VLINLARVVSLPKSSADWLEAFDVKWNAAGDQYAIRFDRRVIIYNMNAEPLTTIEHRVRIHCIHYFHHPVHGETLLTGTDDKLICIHSVSDGKVLQDIKGHRARYASNYTRLMIGSKRSTPPLCLMVLMFEYLHRHPPMAK